MGKWPSLAHEWVAPRDRVHRGAEANGISVRDRDAGIGRGRDHSPSSVCVGHRTLGG
jgi:hypothetical protein